MLFCYIKRVAITFFLLLILLGNVYVSQDSVASSRLPIVTPDMETPEFWIKKIRNPTNQLLTPEGVEKMNEVNLKKQDLHLCRIKDLREDWTGEDILTLLKEDWENFGRTAEVRYGKSGAPLGDFFWDELRNRMNQMAIKESNRMVFGLIIKRTDIRVFPTEEPSLKNSHDNEFDRFQHSSISPGSPVGIYHFSQDKEWVYVQTQIIRGWVRTDHLAIAKERSEVADYETAKDRLVVTGNFIHVFGEPSFQRSLLLSQMGDSFPLLGIPGETKMENPCYVISIPWREGDGQLAFRKGYIRRDEDVHRGFLAYTQLNLALQAFKMLNHPYGWGDRLGGRDCSRFIMDLFRTFGILVPRNSKEQAKFGMDLGVKGKNSSEKRKVLDQAMPLATTLRLPGHIMLYLGKNKGRHYVIHSLWEIQGSEKVETIGKVVVSDLSFGSKGPNGSLLDRITDIRTIGPSPEVRKEK
jgi:hypothetical protein